MIRTCLLQSQCNTASAPEATDALSELHASIPVKYPLDQQKAAAIPEPNITSSGTLTPMVGVVSSGLPLQNAGPAPGVPPGSPVATDSYKESALVAPAIDLDLMPEVAPAAAPESTEAGARDTSPDRIVLRHRTPVPLGVACMPLVGLLPLRQLLCYWEIGC